MKIVVLGGYGVFGSRVSALLARDGHDVWIAGRDLAKAEACACRFGARALEADLRRAPDPVFDVGPEAVVDAAGPFQHYGSDPYRIAKLCIARGVDYFDLSDDARFTSGIGELDRSARAAGCRVLSGASSVPGLSSVVAASLAGKLDTIDVIETAILPGNRAPRGRSVMVSIIGQVGARTMLWRGGKWREAIAWSEPRKYDLGGRRIRAAYLFPVPDVTLFPQFFGARSVLFRAGLELELMNRGLGLIALCRRAGLLSEPLRLAASASWISALFKPLGSDVGGMVVEVTGTKDGASLRRRWTLLAEAGEGPFVPGIVVRALVRRSERIPPGARPCLAEVTLEEIESVMSDLAVTTTSEEFSQPTLFRKALRERWDRLPRPVQLLHSVQDVESFSGTARVERGRGLLARFAAWFFGFPAAGSDVPVTVTKRRLGDGEIWEREFAGRKFRSVCTPSPEPYCYRERFWWFNYEQDLPVSENALHFPVRRGWFLGIPIPKPLLPRSESREYADGDLFHFDVALSAPVGGGLIVRYRGWLRSDSTSLQAPAPDGRTERDRMQA